jgi:hypothetical protein
VRRADAPTIVGHDQAPLTEVGFERLTFAGLLRTDIRTLRPKMPASLARQ